MTNDEQGSIALIGDVGAGKDAFLLSLPALRGKDGLTMELTAVTLDQGGLKVSEHTYTSGEEWPLSTQVFGISELRIQREHASGIGAFYVSTAVVNSPGQILQKLNRGLILTDDDQRGLENIKNAKFLVMTLDIARYLALNEREDEVIREKDRNLSTFIENLFHFIAHKDKGIIDKPTAFCVTKIDGKFIDPGEPQLPSYINERLVTVSSAIRDLDRANVKDKDTLPADKKEAVVAAVDFVQQYWPQTLQFEGYPGTQPQNWTLGELKKWRIVRETQLARGEVNNGSIEEALKNRTSDEIERLIEQKMPLVAAAINGRYSKTPHEFFAISATGNAIIPTPFIQPVNIHLVVSFVLQEMERQRQSKRPLPLWTGIGKFSLHEREPWLEVRLDDTETGS